MSWGVRSLALMSMLALAASFRLPAFTRMPHTGSTQVEGSRISVSRLRMQEAGTERVQMGTLEVSSMGMGTLNWPLNKKVDVAAEAALQACIESGIDFFDTAEAYGFGTSEKLTRSCIEATGASNAKVATKFAPVPWRQEASDVVKACQASAERLGVESIDLYQIHFPDIIQPFKAFGFERRKDAIYWDGIAQCYEQGLIKNVGVSNYGPALLTRAYEALQARGVPLVSNQINFSLLCRKQNNQATVDLCRELGIVPIGYFPLANGLLAGRYSAENMPKGLKARSMRKYVEGGADQRTGREIPAGGVTPLIEELRGVAAGRDKTVAQVAINYAISKGVVPIPGCRNAQMARDNAGAMGWRLSAVEIQRLETAADALGFEFTHPGPQLE